jgi:hypothetical protein
MKSDAVVFGRFAFFLLGFVLAVVCLIANGPESPEYFGSLSWFDAGRRGVLPASSEFDDPRGKLGVLNTGGPTQTKGHPFFEPLGTNGRACVTCHQPGYAMSVSVASLRERWRSTRGADPVFAAIDGSNCPDLPQEKDSSHSLLLNRGLFRVFLPWPPRNHPEFKIEVVRDPTGCNTSDVYGLKSVNPTVSVFRRPRVAANLKYVTVDTGPFVWKNPTLVDVDPETGRRVGMNLMTDAREPTLKTQALSAILTHEEAKTAPSKEQLQKIVDFENGLYLAQSVDQSGGSLSEARSPKALGPLAMVQGQVGVLGDNARIPVFHGFDSWKESPPGAAAQRRAFRASVARGSDIFQFRQFWLSDTTHLNSVPSAKRLKASCATCHNAQMTGHSLSAGWVDLGTNNDWTWTEAARRNDSMELPVFEITCDKSAPPHPYLGRVIYTTDPGRALISGKCADVGSVVMQQFRGISARAPYFSNGSAKTLRELVDFHDRRFNMKLSEAEKQDLVNFLNVL